MAKQHGALPTDQDSSSTNWVLLCSTAVGVLAVGVSVGFVVGNERGKASNAADVRTANNSAGVALAQQTERFNQLVASQHASSAQYEGKLSAAAEEIGALKTRVRDMMAKVDGVAAEKKANEEEAQRRLAVGEGDQNDLALNFIDNPAKFKGQELTVRVRFGPRPSAGRRLEHNLKELVGAYAEAHADGIKRAKVWLYGIGRAGANIDLVILMSPTMDLPAAKLDDPVLVTFKCGSSAESGNVATRVVRPAK